MWWIGFFNEFWFKKKKFSSVFTQGLQHTVMLDKHQRIGQIAQTWEGQPSTLNAVPTWSVCRLHSPTALFTQYKPFKNLSGFLLLFTKIQGHRNKICLPLFHCMFLHFTEIHTPEVSLESRVEKVRSYFRMLQKKL